MPQASIVMHPAALRAQHCVLDWVLHVLGEHLTAAVFVPETEVVTAVQEHVIKPVVPAKYLDDKTIFHLNPSGAAPYSNIAPPCLLPIDSLEEMPLLSRDSMCLFVQGCADRACMPCTQAALSSAARTAMPA